MFLFGTHKITHTGVLYAHVFVVVVVVVGLNAIFQHTIGYTWRPVLMVEEETGKSPERTTDPRGTTGKLSHISTFAES
jgi:hypothetical protein